MKNKMRKIYNEITIGWNEKTQRYDEVLHEDSFMYDGPVMEMQNDYFDVMNPSNSFNVYSDYGCNGYWAGNYLDEPQIVDFTTNDPVGDIMSWAHHEWKIINGILPGFGDPGGGGIGTPSLNDDDSSGWNYLADTGYQSQEQGGEMYTNYEDMFFNDDSWEVNAGFSDIDQNNCVQNISAGSIQAPVRLAWNQQANDGSNAYHYSMWCGRYNIDNVQDTMTNSQWNSIPPNVLDFMNMAPDSTLVCAWSMYNSIGLGGYFDDVGGGYGGTPYSVSGHTIMVRRVPGCTDQNALNYGMNAEGVDVGIPNIDDGSCYYADYSLFHSVEYFGYPDSPDTEPQDLSFVNRVDMDLSNWSVTWPADTVPVSTGEVEENYTRRGWLTHYYDENDPDLSEVYNEFKTGLSWKNQWTTNNYPNATGVAKTGEYPFEGAGYWGSVVPYPQWIAGTEEFPQILEIVVRHPLDYLYANDGLDAQMTDVDWLRQTQYGNHTGLGGSTHPGSMGNVYENSVMSGHGAGLQINNYNSMLGAVTGVYEDNELLGPNELGTTWRASIKCFAPESYFHENSDSAMRWYVMNCNAWNQVQYHPVNGDEATCDNYPPLVDVVLYGGNYKDFTGAQNGKILALNRVRYECGVNQWSDEMAVKLNITDPDIDHLGIALEFPNPWHGIDGQVSDDPMPQTWRDARDGFRYYFDRLNVQSLSVDVWPESSQPGGSGNKIQSSETITLDASATIDVDEEVDGNPVTACDWVTDHYVDPGTNPNGCHIFEWLFIGCVDQNYQNWSSPIGTYNISDTVTCNQVASKIETDLGLSDGALGTQGAWAEAVLSRTKELPYTAPDLLHTRQPILNLALKVIDYDDLQDYDLINLMHFGSNHAPLWHPNIAVEIQPQIDPSADSYEKCTRAQVIQDDATCNYSINEDFGLDAGEESTGLPGIIDIRPFMSDADYPDITNNSEWYKWARDIDGNKLALSGDSEGTGAIFWSIDTTFNFSDHIEHPIQLTEGLTNGATQTSADWGVAHVTWNQDLMENCENITNAANEFGTCMYKYRIKFWAQDPGNSIIVGYIYFTVTSTDNPMTWDPTSSASTHWGDGFVATGGYKEFFHKSGTISGAIQDEEFILYARDYESCPDGTYAYQDSANVICHSCQEFGGGNDDPNQCLFYENNAGTSDSFDLTPVSGTGIIKWGANSDPSGIFSSDVNDFIPAAEITYDDAQFSSGWMVGDPATYCPNSTLSIEVRDDADNPIFPDVSIPTLCPPAWDMDDWGSSLTINETETITDHQVNFYVKPNGDYDDLDGAEGWLANNILFGLRSDTFGDLFVNGETGYQIPIWYDEGQGDGSEDTGLHVTLTPGPLLALKYIDVSNLHKFYINMHAPRVDGLHATSTPDTVDLPFSLVLCDKQLMMAQSDGTTPHWYNYCNGTPTDTALWGDSCVGIFEDILFCPAGCTSNVVDVSGTGIDEDACIEQDVVLTINGTTTVNDALTDDDISDWPEYTSYIHTLPVGVYPGGAGELEQTRQAEEICTCVGSAEGYPYTVVDCDIFPPSADWENNGFCNDSGIFTGLRGFALYADEQTEITSISFEIETNNDNDQVYFASTNDPDDTVDGIGGVVNPVGENVGAFDLDPDSPTYNMYPVTCVWNGEGAGVFQDMWNCGFDFKLDLQQATPITEDLFTGVDQHWSNERWVTFKVLDNYWNCTPADTCGESTNVPPVEFTQADHQVDVPILIRVFDTNDAPIIENLTGDVILYEDDEAYEITLRCTDKDGDPVKFYVGDADGSISGLPAMGTLYTHELIGSTWEPVPITAENEELQDINGTPQYEGASEPPYGVTTTVLYQPTLNQWGPDSFTVYCKDFPPDPWDDHMSIPVTVDIEILPINDPPVIDVSISEGSS